MRTRNSQYCGPVRSPPDERFPLKLTATMESGRNNGLVFIPLAPLHNDKMAQYAAIGASAEAGEPAQREYGQQSIEEVKFVNADGSDFIASIC